MPATPGLRQARRLANPIARFWLAAALSLGAIGPAVGAGSERALIRDAGFRDGDVGYVVFDLQAGEVVRSHQPEKPFIPASMVKIATALAALEILGPDHRFLTRVLARRTGEGLHLHLAGGGDPVFVQEHVHGLARVLATAVAGRDIAQFTFDEALLPSVPQIDPSDDGLKPYNPPVSALSVNFNRQWLRWVRDGETRAMLVSIRPELDHAVAGIAARTLADGRSIQAIDGLRTVYLLDPRVPSAGQRQVTVRRPALRTAAMLRAYAAREGLIVPPPQRRPVPPPGAEAVAAHLSDTLLEISENLLKYSNNLSAELVGLAAARALRPDVPDLSAGAAVVSAWLGQKVPELAGNGWRVPNQSGLSGAARATPGALLALLRYAADREYAQPPDAAEIDGEAKPFLTLLREPRWTGKDDDLEVRGKSGTMFYARGNAGALRGASGKPMLFVLMHNDLDARQRYESDPARFTAPVQIAARAWLARARRLEQSVILHWVATL